MIFKKVFCFLLLFCFLFLSSSFAQENQCTLVSGGVARPGQRACGHEAETSLGDNYILECMQGSVSRADRNPPYTWGWTREICTDRPCVGGECVSQDCEARSGFLPAASHEERVCTLDGSKSYQCLNGEFRNPEACEEDYTGDDNTSDNDRDIGDDDEGSWWDEISEDEESQNGGNNNSGGSSSGGGGSWFGINTADGVGWALSPGGEIDYFKLVLEAIIGLAGVVAAGFIVFGAYTLITASGEPENIAKGQKMITNAVIGLIIAALAFLIVNFVIVELPMPE